jgi:hypothetical protein
MGYGMQNSRSPQVGGHNVQRVQNYTPQQMQLHERGFENVAPGSYTARLAAGDQSLFNEMEAPAMRQFGEMQGENASRFSGMGMGARRGSGFQNFQNQATSNFAQDLQSRRQELQRNAIQDMMSMSNQILSQRPYENILVEPNKKKSFWQKLIGGGAPIVGGIAGGVLGGPAGAMAGFQAGNAVGQAFNGEQGGQMDYSGMANLPNNWDNWGNSGNMLQGASGMQSRGNRRGLGYAGAY